MNRFLLVTVLITLSMQGKLRAQTNDALSNWFANSTTTERTFSISHNHVNIRDFIHIGGSELILELDNVNDFDRLKHLDSLLLEVRKNIAFYKDSLEANKGANLLIEYVLQEGYDFKEMRFTKHRPQGDMYVNKQGEVSILKIEQDTIKMVMHVNGKEYESYWREAGSLKRSKEKKKFTIRYDIQVMLCMNNYTDIDKVIADSVILHRMIDTLQTTTPARTIKDPVKFPTSSTCRVNKTTRSLSVTNYKGIIKNDKSSILVRPCA